ncbi:unnamed protein product [Eruca vesicaria subsp. sativa]|uniref:tryptophan--tRNA ligase n=1 Tax=Eruca vesicaria subsp. sativa TaxID=29727 RepID=A0ABC8LQP2_ERUVS|nr:unnamed protein product [Eruca vesicaria subsp. sativa]
MEMKETRIERIQQLIDEERSSIHTPQEATIIQKMSQLLDELRSLSESSSEQVVTPWTVHGTIDYRKMIEIFGCKEIDESLIDRVERLTSRRAHVFLRRGFFYAHRDLDKILDCYERGEKFYLYTGRGPSSESLHLGHLIPFLFTKYLQDAFEVPLVIQITDDEKCIWKKLKPEDSKRLGRENVKDIIACGFDVKKTFIFSNFDTVGGSFYENMVEAGKCVTLNKIRSTFGFTGEDCVSKISFPMVQVCLFVRVCVYYASNNVFSIHLQAVPSFPSSFPDLFPGIMDKLRCLIPCAIDQDPYFRMTRDVAPRLGYRKPALIESKFFPALRGKNGKMSASDANSAIYLNDSAKDIKRKINSAVTGGRDNMEDQIKYGANLKEDIPFQYLSFFLEDDAELEHIRKEYGEGRMQSGQVKKRLAEVVVEVVEKHRNARAAVTEEMVEEFMAVRDLSQACLSKETRV